MKPYATFAFYIYCNFLFQQKFLLLPTHVVLLLCVGWHGAIVVVLGGSGGGGGVGAAVMFGISEQRQETIAAREFIRKLILLIQCKRRSNV